MASKKIENMSFEASVEELETIVQQLEQGDLPLGKALTQFERGIGLARNGQQKLQGAQQKVDILMANNGESALTPFDNSQES
ncbi:exodeoxyribonuclease VII small subunit [Psychrobium sp. nBUS_13]|uniref:exodeoxyribonuclease VII small subunit n=1 Tax=Psychrobium sp. nBUS_13 TaxID=3395319 RepID=UPI003EC07CE1